VGCRIARSAGKKKPDLKHTAYNMLIGWCPA
jgi:hypothetical protein